MNRPLYKIFDAPKQMSKDEMSNYNYRLLIEFKLIISEYEDALEEMTGMDSQIILDYIQETKKNKEIN